MKRMIISLLMLSAISLTACQKQFQGDEPKPWDSTTETFTSFNDDVDAAFTTYYKHALGRMGDPMPFYDKNTGDFKILYLQDYNNNKGSFFHPIWALSTKDCVNYENLGEIIPVGTNVLQQDAALGTGCCYYCESEKLYYIYYTGENGACDCRQVVMRATSKDFVNWTKDPLWRLSGPEFGLAKDDFRDPQIFEDTDGYHMVISSNLCFAHFKSQNMKDWTYEGRFNMIWDRMLECPDVFKMGNWWYLVYSEAYKDSWSRKVKYMMADSFENLMRCFDDPGAHWPKDDKEGVLDSRAFYAAKTAAKGDDRYIWGWCPYRSGVTYHDKNINVGAGKGNEPNWSGALVCHKLIQHENGTLTVGEVPAMEAKYSQKRQVKVMDSVNYENGTISGDGYVLFNRLGTHNHISFTAKTAGDGDWIGVSFCRGSDADRYYSLLLAPEWENGRRKINLEQEGPNGDGFIEAADGYIFPRPSDNVYNIDIYTDNSVVTMYVNGDYGFTARIYGIYKNCWSINSRAGGKVEISDLTVSEY
ncbi:MAG: DUF4975 domain-containing protein [Bacteroidales bacterium]|nr:DUF4975 domain-containing protein [Bacteroidales bacterium]